MFERLAALLLASVISLFLVGCGQQGPIKNNSNRLQTAFFAKGPAARLASIDEEVMIPALALVEQIESGRAKSDANQLNKLQAGMNRLKGEEIVRLNDAYLFFGKRYLLVLEEYIKLSIAKEDAKAKQIKLGKLEDTKLAFVNARNIVLNQKGIYKLASLDAKQLHKGMTYEELRSLLQMPGDVLESFTVTDYENQSEKKIQPILWVDKGQCLYVEFVEGRSNTWKLQKGIDFGKKAERKIRNQIAAWDQELVQPVWKLYEAYCNNKNKLAKQKIYDGAAAKKQKSEIDKVLLGVSKGRTKLGAVDKNVEDTRIYCFYAEQLFKEIEERMQCSLKLADDANNKEARQGIINRGNRLESWEIWRTYFIYSNALKIKTEGRPNYQFPKSIVKDFSKKLWSGNLMHRFKMPSDHVHRHMVQDQLNPQKFNRHDIHLWVQGNGYMYGYFVNERLEKWQTFWVNDGFYHEM